MCSAHLTDAAKARAILLLNRSRFDDERRHQTCSLPANLLPAYLSFTIGISENIYSPPHCVLFIKFHFTFIRQHSCRLLFCSDLGHFTDGLAGDVCFCEGPMAAMSFCVATVLWFAIARIMS